jgi:aspartyl-tRNA(Asn)/glutamyl-tRNA(Gln) amidotransferase subunit B
MDYQPIIGLEIHVELNTKSKMFCSCPNNPNECHPNVNICPTCTAQPGTLPVINEEAVKKVIKTGLALNCQIPERSKFDRKNYFYPDLPKGYQISQYDLPLCKDGFLEIDGKKIKITRVHLEEDTGRLIHQKGYSLVDFNRAGIPLMELVTEPDIRSSEEVKKFTKELQLILRYLGVSDADMEKGQMRVELNLSLSRREEELGTKLELGTKVEIKNINSTASVIAATEYEIERQTEVLESGKKIIQETRGWDDARGITISQREKEEAFDYRYFPEPDLPPLYFKKEEIDEIRRTIPELPQQKRTRFKREYELDAKSIEIFVSNKSLGDYFEKVISELEPRLQPEKLLNLTKLATNYLISDLQGLLKGASILGDKFLITPENFAEFISLIYDGKISSKIAKIVLEEMFKSGADPSHIIEEKELILISDEAEIEKIAREVISKNQKAASDFKQKKENAIQFLIGQVMKETKGKANPEVTKNLLTKILKKIN